VVVVPFFISDGLHSYEDIPRLLGIASKRSTGLRSPERPTARQATTSRTARGEIFQRNPHKIVGRSLFYAPSIGTDPGFADIIIEQAAKFGSKGDLDRGAKLIAKS
jgi:sirohydrochlorin cobaltochelatase